MTCDWTSEGTRTREIPAGRSCLSLSVGVHVPFGLRKVFCLMIKFLPHLEANEAKTKASGLLWEWVCSIHVTPGLKQEVCDRHTSGLVLQDRGPVQFSLLHI